MSEDNPIMAKALSLLIDERIKVEVLFDVMIEKGIITGEELKEMYTEKLDEKQAEYAAESLGLTIEEYKKMVE